MDEVARISIFARPLCEELTERHFGRDGDEVELVLKQQTRRGFLVVTQWLILNFSHESTCHTRMYLICEISERYVSLNRV